jgi:hypothetical protein
MPLYHFDLRDGATFVVDDEGMELLDIESAQVEAVESLREMVRELALRASKPAGHPMSVEVRDLNGSLFQLSFMFAYRQMQ